MRENHFQDMTPEERLKQIEILLGTAAKAINNLTQRTDDNARAIADNTRAIADNAREIAQLREDNAREIAQLQVNTVAMLEMLSQWATLIRGIQTENQRILRHLFGENEN